LDEAVPRSSYVLQALPVAIFLQLKLKAGKACKNKYSLGRLRQAQPPKPKPNGDPSDVLAAWNEEVIWLLGLNIVIYLKIVFWIWNFLLTLA
jgi:hypothetical protein